MVVVLEQEPGKDFAEVSRWIGSVSPLRQSNVLIPRCEVSPDGKIDPSKLIVTEKVVYITKRIA